MSTKNTKGLDNPDTPGTHTHTQNVHLHYAKLLWIKALTERPIVGVHPESLSYSPQLQPCRQPPGWRRVFERAQCLEDGVWAAQCLEDGVWAARCLSGTVFGRNGV